MRVSYPVSLLAVAFAAALSSYGCDDEVAVQTRIGAPSPPGSSPAFVSRAVSVRPAVAEAQIIGSAVCPTHPSFVVPFSLVFGDHTAGFSLSRVQMQFVDTTGFRSAPVTLPRTELASRFGSLVIPAVGSRTFPFTFPFGCIRRPIGWLTIVVVAEDRHGRENTTTLEVGVRVPETD